MKHYDVIVVGAGLVGRVLLRALKTLPLKVAFIEKKHQTNVRDPRSITLSPSSQMLLKRLDLWAALQSHITPMASVSVSYEARFGVSHLKASEVSAQALGYVVPAQALHHVLQQSITEIDAYCPAELQSIQHREQNIEVSLSDGRILSAQLLIATDGKDSAVRQHQKIQAKHYVYDQQALISLIQVSQPHQHVAYEKMLSDGALALLPRAGRHMGLVWALPTSRCQEVASWSDQVLMSYVNQRFGKRLGAWLSLEDRVQFPLSASRAERITAQRVVLLGNAAMTLHPIAGQGLNLAWRDVMVLISMLQDGLAQSSDLGGDTLLNQYERLRRWDHKMMFEFTHRLHQIGQRSNPIKSLLHHGAMAAIDNFPPLKQSFLRFTMGQSMSITPSISRWLQPQPKMVSV